MGKVDRIVETLGAQIRDGALKPGRRLPSLRAAALEFGVSKNTIVDAYDRLCAAGLARPIHGSGFYVTRPDAAPADLNVPPKHVVEAVNSISLLNAQLVRGLTIRIGDGRPPESWMRDSLRGALHAKVRRSFESDRIGYGNAFGYNSLRERIAMRHRTMGLPISVDQIVTTFGANHALDLITRRFLEPDDAVLVDDPGYYPLLAKLKLSKNRVLGVPRTPYGPDVDVLARLAQRHGPKIFFTQSTCQNPTGTSMTPAVAHAVLQVAAKHGILVVDNDPFVDLPGDHGTRLATLDQFNSVVAISTYSKLLSASFRVGYLVAPKPIANEIAELKLVTVVNSSRFLEIVIAEMIMTQRYQRHLNDLARRLKEAYGAFHDRIDKLGLDVFSRQASGFYTFLLLPPGLDEETLMREAIDRDIFLAPGKLFHTTGDGNPPALRVNVARANEPRFFNFLKSTLAAHGR
ncbi:MAG: PLP-dependent aminotransferase family protein [Rhodobacterales bacterium]|nr:PLP-dependent aminotransferase family protein [Rhodobacterales bacterium]